MHLLDNLQALLKCPLPGLQAQALMMPTPRPGMERAADPDHTPREGGVLIALYPREGELALVLTRRADTLSSHRGQISLPGGSREAVDADFVATAVREANEELGIPADQLRILGTLTPLYIPPSDYRIYPVVAFLADMPDFVPDPREVAEVIEVPLVWLTDKRHIRQETRELRGAQVEIPFFELNGHKVWGATAMVLAELRALLLAAQAEEGLKG